MQVFNVRAGFATNSSSSHSIVMLAPGTTERDDEYSRFEYGWENFTLSDSDSKTAYLAVQLRMALEKSHIPSHTAVQLVNSWLGTQYDAGELEAGYVDHQSVWNIFDGALAQNPEFVREFHEWLVKQDVVILGGNDNSEGQPPPEGSYENDLTQLVSTWGNNLRVRKDGAYWVLFDPDRTGNKLRFSFDDQAPQYAKSATPELVDLKLSNWCGYGCEFCLVPGTQINTPWGVIPIEQITQGDEVLAYNCVSNQIESAEVAETYERDYDGDLYEIELDNGTKVCITPEHEIFVKGKGWIQAMWCEENDQILHIKEAI